MASTALQAVQEDEPLGQLEQLASPVLAKIKPALIALKLCITRQKGFGRRTMVLKGKHGMELHMAYFKEKSMLAMAMKGSSREAMKAQIETVQPQWLAGVWPGAEVVSVFLEMFDSLRDDSHRNLADCIKAATGGVTPRKVFNVGHCGGGAAATVTALWMALQCPTADVRCITFGSPKAGNAAFTEAFRWLVGVSYRVIYRKDSIPAAMSVRNAFLKHVHGAVYIRDGEMQAGEGPASAKLNTTIADHSFQRYAEAVYAVCLRHLERDHALGGSLYSTFAACYLKMAGDDIELGPSFQKDVDKAYMGQQKAVTLPRAAEAAVVGLPPQKDIDKAYMGQQKAVTPPQAVHAGVVPMQIQDNAIYQAVRDQLKDEERQRQLAARQASSREASTAEPGQAAESGSSTPGKPSPAAIMADIKRRVGWDHLAAPQQVSDEQQMVQAAEGSEQVADGSESPRYSEEQMAQLGQAFLHASLLGTEAEATRLRELKAEYHRQKQQRLAAAAGHSEGLEADGSQAIGGKAAVDAAAAGAEGAGTAVEGGERWNHRPTLQQTRSQGSGALGNSAARRVVAGVVDEATGGMNAGIGPSDGEGGGSAWLKRAFSMLDREDLEVDLSRLDSMAKILAVGKLSQAVVIAAAAYRDEATFRERTGISNSRLVVNKKNKDCHVHVGWLPEGTAVFAFRGTDTAQDGLQDVKIMRRNIDYLQDLFPGVKAHVGFLQQFAAVNSLADPEHSLSEVLKELSGGAIPNRVLCCGHSLGGALATLGAAWAALEYPQADVRCITFGSPRVGNSVFKKAFHTLVGTSYRIIQGADPVPTLPPAFNYKHVDNCMHILKDQIHLRHRPWHFKLRFNIADHMVARYNAGIWLHAPGGLESMPLPHPKLRQRGCSTDRAGSGKARPLGRDSTDMEKGSRRESCRMPKTGGSEWSLLNFLACMPVANLAMKQQVDEEQGSSDDDSVSPTVSPKEPQLRVDSKAHTFHNPVERPYEQLPPVTVMETSA